MDIILSIALILTLVLFVALTILVQKEFKNVYKGIASLYDSFNYYKEMSKTIDTTCVKSAFKHQHFMDTVAAYYRIRPFPDSQIKSYVKSVSTGIPVSTNIFICLCNEMKISPLNFFTTK